MAATATDEAPPRDLPMEFDPVHPPDPADYVDWTLDQILIGLRIVGRDLYVLRRSFRSIIEDHGTTAQKVARARARARTRQRAADLEAGVKRTIPDLDDIATTDPEVIEAEDEHLVNETRLEVAKEARRILVVAQSALQTAAKTVSDMERVG